MKRIIDAPNAAPTLFPPLQFVAFLRYIRAVWENAKDAAPRWWTSEKETVLVDGFYRLLNTDIDRIEHGVGFGHFILEASEIEIDPKTEMPKRIGRTDISFAHASNLGPTLTLEFKRLNNKAALRRQYFLEGVSRFVAGKYAPAHDTAMMVGMVKGAAETEKAGLLRYLRLPQAKSTLKLKPLSHPEYGDHSADAPFVDFDTLHCRAPTCIAPEIRVGHILLER